MMSHEGLQMYYLQFLASYLKSHIMSLAIISGGIGVPGAFEGQGSVDL